MAIVAKFRSNILNSEINKLANFYEAEISESERLRIQLELFEFQLENDSKKCPLLPITISERDFTNKV